MKNNPNKGRKAMEKDIAQKDTSFAYNMLLAFVSVPVCIATCYSVAVFERWGGVLAVALGALLCAMFLRRSNDLIAQAGGQKGWARLLCVQVVATASFG